MMGKIRTKEQRLAQLKKILNALETRIPVVPLQRIEEVYTVLIKKLTVEITEIHREENGSKKPKTRSEKNFSADTFISDCSYKIGRSISPNEKHTNRGTGLSAIHAANRNCNTDRQPSGDDTHMQGIYVNQFAGVAGFGDKKVFECASYDKTSATTDYLNIQKKSRASTNHSTHKCEICSKILAHSSSLKRHQLIHTDKRLYKCSICDKRCLVKRDLERHLIIHTTLKPYTCDICKQTFKHYTSMNYHKLSHTGKKPHKCDICHEAFKNRDTWKDHVNKHLGLSPYKCDTCNQLFSRLFNLQRHQIIHTGENPYECDICKKTFRRRVGIVGHMTDEHNADRPYKCELCNWSFKRKDHFVAHQVIHCGKRPYDCAQCNKTFRRKDTLKSHHQRKHSGQ